MYYNSLDISKDEIHVDRTLEHAIYTPAHIRLCAHAVLTLCGENPVIYTQFGSLQKLGEAALF